MTPSPEFPFTKQRATINGSEMAYVDEGTGPPIVLLHGNPTSSYLWRNIIPHLTSHGRCIAPDLIGMGDSDKLNNTGPDSYTFTEHRTYLDGLLEHLDINNDVTLVLHDWGSGLGFDWANRHRDAVTGIAYMEAMVHPYTWDEFPDGARDVFAGFRSSAGEDMVLDQNLFVEAVLPTSIIRELSDAEMSEYRRPFINPGEDRRPTLTWPRQIPIDGEPADVLAIVENYANWLATSDVRKLFINAEPGALINGAALDACRTWPNQTEVTVPGIHFIQEDSPHEIGQAISDWLADQ